MVCSTCGGNLSNRSGVKCTRCELSYHRICVRLTINQRIGNNWKCPTCKRVLRWPQFNPLNLVADSIAEYIDIPSPLETFTIRELVNDVRSLKHEVDCIKHEVRTDLKQIKEVVVECCWRLKGDFDFQNPNNKPIDQLLKYLRQLLHARDQDQFENDLVIFNLPEFIGEDQVEIVKTIAINLDIVIYRKDVLFTKRLGRLKKFDDTSSNGLEITQRRPLVARFATRALHEQIIRIAKTRRYLTSADLYMEGPAYPFFIQERLTPFHLELFKLTKSVCKAARFRFLWTARGRIMIRKEIGQEAIQIRDEYDLLHLLGEYSSQ